MSLPSPLQSYFDADKKLGGAPPVDAFAPEAIVRDEGKTHVGREAIAAWWRAAKAQYQHSAEPREVSHARGRIIVLAEVRGQFAGSPALLNFTFTLKRDQIASLEVGA